MKELCLLNILYLVGLAVFLFGFFPYIRVNKNDEGKTSLIKEISAPQDGRKAPLKQLVFIVIDALRADFILNDGLQRKSMPFLQRLLKDGRACAYSGVAHTPTVTMPRIKSIVSGTVPSFVDVIFNMGSSDLKDDNFIKQLRNMNRTAIFYGDDTWLRLFPNEFLRSDGTSSFFVNDYTEVDANVTRHISSELARNDWTLMILHYLGLDHIGHLAGPRSSLVPTKLQEMDQVIEKIYTKFKRKDTGIVICGDHGMSESGSHGGSSAAETKIPLVFLVDDCSEDSQEVLQVDLAPTVSKLLGLPIPEKNVGLILPGILSSALFSPEEQKEAVLENFRMLLQQTFQEDITALQVRELLDEFVHLNDSDPRTGLVREKLCKLGRKLSEKLAESRVNFDGLTMMTGISLQLQVLLLLVLEGFALPLQLKFSQAGVLQWFRWSVCSLLACCLVMALGAFMKALVLVCSWLVFLRWIFPNMARVPVWFRKERRFIFPKSVLVASTFVHVFSLGSSSFVEEEHQTFYFLWNTFCCVLFLWNGKSGGNLGILAAMVLQRIGRSWNQTGDKWANEADIEDFLLQSDNQGYLTLSAVLGTLGTMFWIHRRQNLSTFQLALCGLASTSILMFRTATGALYLGTLYPSSMGVIEARLALGAIFLLILLSRRTNYLASLTTGWVLLSQLLRRPHNLLLLLLHLFQYSFLEKSWRPLGITEHALAHYWLGMVWYFQQGNSNSFSRVDISAGYIGLDEHNSILAGLLTCCSTYVGPVLSFLLGLKHCRGGLHFCRVYLTERVFVTSVFCVLVTALRYHLFIWSVFSPKLLYECVLSLVISVLLLAAACFH